MESDFTVRNEVDSVMPPHADEVYHSDPNNGYSQVNFQTQGGFQPASPS